MKKASAARKDQFDASLAELLRAVRPLLLLGLAVLLGLAFMRQTTTKVSIDVLVTSLTWQNAELPTTDPEWFGLELQSYSHGQFVLDAATITTGPRLPAGEPLVLQPRPPFQPVRMHLLALPAQASVQLTQADTTRLQLVISPLARSDSAALLKWRLEVGACQYLDPATNTPHSLCAASTRDTACILLMQKDLRSGEPYTFGLVRAGTWKAPARQLASALRFTETDVRQTVAISSVLSGKVKLLETSDPPVELAERDVLDVRFEQPVELYLKGTPAGIQVHVDGEASRLLCGPRIMGEENNLLPRRLKSLYDKAPYLSALATLLLSLFAIDRFWVKRKSS